MKKKSSLSPRANDTLQLIWTFAVALGVGISGYLHLHNVNGLNSKSVQLNSPSVAASLPSGALDRLPAEAHSLQ